MRRALPLVALAALIAASSGGAVARSDAAADEVLVEFARSAGARAIDNVQRRHHLLAIEQRRMSLTGVTVYRWRIADRRPVAKVVRELKREAAVASAQPNYRFSGEDRRPKSRDRH